MNRKTIEKIKQMKFREIEREYNTQKIIIGNIIILI